MTPLFLAMPGNEAMARSLAGRLSATLADAEVRPFPDGETYIRVDCDVKDAHAAIVCTLDRPNEKVVPLSLLAATLRDLGAARIGLIAAYLPYMRQDKRFRPGEGVTSAYFARILEGSFDWLATIDPHLHRRSGLSEIYRIATSIGHAAPAIGAWIRRNVSRPLIVGPDSESEQWVEAVAREANASYIVLSKVRLGDRDVQLASLDTTRWASHTPVLVDDVISTGRTMIAAASQFREKGFGETVILAIHALFSGSALDELRRSGADRVITCNSVQHPTNAIDISGPLAEAVRQLHGHASSAVPVDR